MPKIVLLIIAIFLSPLAVFLLDGLNANFWINLILWIISLSLLGIIHAWYLILTRPA